MQTSLRERNLPTAYVWDELVAWSGLLETSRQAIDRSLARTLSMPAPPFDMGIEYDRRFQRLHAEVAARHPTLERDLPLRVGPMRDAWETVGPGLIGCLERRTERGLVVSAATVIVVHPFRGGGGSAHLASDSVAWEGMLANPHPELPETLRLAWLLSQLGLDVARYEDVLEEDDLPRIASLAMIPATLAAAEDLDLARCDEATVARALDVWHVLDRFHDRAAEALHSWWRTYCERRPPWETALTALEQIMPVE